MQWLGDGWQRQKRRKRLVASTEKPKVKKQILSDMPRITSQIILIGAKDLIIQPKMVHCNCGYMCNKSKNFTFIYFLPSRLPQIFTPNYSSTYILLTSIEIIRTNPVNNKVEHIMNECLHYYVSSRKLKVLMIHLSLSVCSLIASQDFFAVSVPYQFFIPLNYIFKSAAANRRNGEKK